MITYALLIGLIFGFLYYERFGLSPGGIITPGYFALFIQHPTRIFVTIAVALIVWGIVELLAKYLIIYGRRKFLLCILLGFLLKLLIENFVQPNVDLPFELISIGYLIPGLIANEISKQKLINTFSSITIVTFGVYVFMLLIGG